MIPYYSDDHVTIYHGDCRDILGAVLEPADVIVTDPPYGISAETDYSGLRGTDAYYATKSGRRTHGKTYAAHRRRRRAVSTAVARRRGPCAISARTITSSGSRTAGLSTYGTRETDSAPTCSPIANSYGRRSRPDRRVCIGISGSAICALSENDAYLHPTQKPVSLMRWILEWSPAGRVVDPYVGSGSTLRGAKDAGRHAVGIELVEAYCEIAARRLGQEVLPFAESAYPIDRSSYARRVPLVVGGGYDGDRRRAPRARDPRRGDPRGDRC